MSCGREAFHGTCSASSQSASTESGRDRSALIENRAAWMWPTDWPTDWPGVVACQPRGLINCPCRVGPVPLPSEYPDSRARVRARWTVAASVARLPSAGHTVLSNLLSPRPPLGVRGRRTGCVHALSLALVGWGEQGAACVLQVLCPMQRRQASFIVGVHRCPDGSIDSATWSTRLNERVPCCPADRVEGAAIAAVAAGARLAHDLTPNNARCVASVLPVAVRLPARSPCLSVVALITWCSCSRRAITAVLQDRKTVLLI